MLKDGRLRWARLENLFQEGSKSADFDPAQLWLLAEWVASEGGRSVRRPLAAELVRLVDAVITGAARTAIAERSGSGFLLTNPRNRSRSSDRREFGGSFTIFGRSTFDAPRGITATPLSIAHARNRLAPAT